MNTSVDRTTPPARIGHYLLGEKLGQGGMGVVYSAQDELQSRPVAIKFLIAKWAKDPRAIECFHQEACIASTLKHLHLCAVYEFGDVVDGPYMVMELLSGQTLRDLLNGWPLALVRTLDIAIQVADAMEAVHGTGIIHRDITSSNIFITETGLVKVLDFGLAKLCDRTQPESAPAVASPSGPSIPSLTFGTTSYMSPEQTAGQELDQRSDIFSLGIVLYEMATGMLPFPRRRLGKNHAVDLIRSLSARFEDQPQSPRCARLHHYQGSAEGPRLPLPDHGRAQECSAVVRGVIFNRLPPGTFQAESAKAAAADQHSTHKGVSGLPYGTARAHGSPRGIIRSVSPLSLSLGYGRQKLAPGGKTKESKNAAHILIHDVSGGNNLC